MAKKEILGVLLALITFGCNTTQEGITQDHVTTRVALSSEGVSQCYTASYGSKHIPGKVILLVHINAQGQTEGVSVESSTYPNPFTSCLVALAQKWTFPRPHTGGLVMVRVPINVAFGSGHTP